MKKLMIIASCTLLLLAAGCKPHEPESLAGKVPQPAWQKPSEYDYSSSMTAVISVNLLASYPNMATDYELRKEDMIAAFIGDKCCGVANPQGGVFFLFVADVAPSYLVERKVTLRYWSAFYKNMFVATDAFTFANGSRLGDQASPITPLFVVQKQ